MTPEVRKKIESAVNYALGIREQSPCEAIEILKELNSQYPNEAALNGLIAGTYFTYLRDFSNALPYFRTATILSPKSELASLGLFHSLTNLGRDLEALEEARRFTRLNGVTTGYELLFDELDENGVFD